MTVQTAKNALFNPDGTATSSFWKELSRFIGASSPRASVVLLTAAGSATPIFQKMLGTIAGAGNYVPSASSQLADRDGVPTPLFQKFIGAYL